jgi:hypothetical protein
MGMHITQGKGHGKPREVQTYKEPVYPNMGVPHSECSQRETWGGTYVGKLGDVRRCQHGKIQTLVKPVRDWYGPGTWYWVTLHPVFDYFKYQKAKKLLG